VYIRIKAIPIDLAKKNILTAIIKMPTLMKEIEAKFLSFKIYSKSYLTGIPLRSPPSMNIGIWYIITIKKKLLNTSKK